MKTVEKLVSQQFSFSCDPLSPNIFNCVLEQVVRELNWEDKGIKLHGTYINNLRFADDTVLISEDWKVIESMVEELVADCEKVGLEINISKTKFMSNDQNKKKQSIGCKIIDRVT